MGYILHLLVTEHTAVGLKKRQEKPVYGTSSCSAIHFIFAALGIAVLLLLYSKFFRSCLECICACIFCMCLWTYAYDWSCWVYQQAHAWVHTENPLICCFFIRYKRNSFALMYDGWLKDFFYQKMLLHLLDCLDVNVTLISVQSVPWTNYCYCLLPVVLWMKFTEGWVKQKKELCSLKDLYKITYFYLPLILK